MPGSKRICRQCLNDDRYLNNIIASDPDASESCDYCDSEEMTMSMETLAEKVDWLIENYYRGGEYNHYLEEYEGEPLFSVLEQEVTVNDNIINDLSELLDELWFDWSSHERKYGDEAHFVEAVTISGNLSRKWNSMERKLRESNRFFNMDAMATFEEVFTYLHENHPSAFIDFGPNKPIFRGRIFQSEDALEIALRMPESSFGPPPPELTPSGRMNARGISVFYGATSRKNAISEVRPPVGSYVAVAEFTLLRTVRLLDLSSLKGLAVNGFSRFDPEYLLRYERSSFIQNLSRKLVMPVVPELEETNYLLTQAIADYLSTFERCELDGILFTSAQKPKESTDPSVMNIILFHKSSGVLNADRRFREAEVNMYQHDEDISYFDPEIRTTPDDFRREFKVLSSKKNREDILELKLDGIEVHKIEGVDYSTSETTVTHYLTEGRTKEVISHAKSGYSDDEF